MVEEEEQEEEEEEASSEEEVEEAEEKEEEPEEDKTGLESTTSVASGLDTPETIQLRKQKDGTGTETPDTVDPRPKALYTVLEEKPTSVPTNAMFGSAHTYVLPSASSAPPTTSKDSKRKEAKKPGEVAVAFTPEELENLDAGTLKRKYDAQLEAEKAATRVDRTDINEVIEEQSRKKRRKETGKDKGKKYKF